MNKSIQVFEMGLVSGLLGLIFEYIGAIRLVYIILIAVIAIDTITGVAVALKNARFSIRGFVKFIRKFFTYSVSVVTVRLLEISLLGFFEMTILSQIMGIFLVINETVSILENMAILGVPLPSNFVSFLLGQIRIPGLDRLVENAPRSTDEHINEIDDVIRYQISTFDNKCMKRMLEIKFEACKLLLKQLKEMFRGKNPGQGDLLYYRVVSYVQNMNSDVEGRWEKEEIPKKCIESFKKFHADKMDRWLYKVRKLCYSNESPKGREEKLAESIMILLYQMITDARKGFDNL